ncbi:hypothetical protein ACFOGJ_04285 [Marinibaculum pumilum]|uniref:Uncharacterized protein n=1 Tax=Marinibaculum pumilum TaxID=1766165 RepID=A0ABV7KVN4_9PROT
MVLRIDRHQAVQQRGRHAAERVQEAHLAGARREMLEGVQQRLAVFRPQGLEQHLHAVTQAGLDMDGIGQHRHGRRGGGRWLRGRLRHRLQ